MDIEKPHRREFLKLGAAALAAAVTAPGDSQAGEAAKVAATPASAPKKGPAVSILRAKSLITGVSNRRDVNIIENGAVLQRDGVIAEIGTFEALKARFPDVPVVGTGREIVFPGMVNGHHHVGVTPLQLGAPDLPLELWISARLGTRGPDPYLDTLYGAFEMLESGVTTVQHLNRGLALGTPEDLEKNYSEVIRAYTDLGMRVSFSSLLRDQSFVVYANDVPTELAFMAKQPEPLKSWGKERIEKAVSLADNLAVFESMYKRYAGNPLVKIQLAPANLHWCSDKALKALGDMSEKYNATMHMHLVETKYQKGYALKRSGKTALEHIAQFGLVNPRMTLGHGVWLSDSDIERVGASGCSICQNCSSNMRLRSGQARLQMWESKGVNIAMGMDEAGINDDRDMLQEMRMVLNSHRVPGMNPDDVPSAGQVLRMATSGGAKTTQFADTIGELRVGAAADAVFVDYDQIGYPHLDSRTPLVNALVQRTKTKNVTTVVCAGETVYANGEFTKVNRKAILEALHKNMDRPLTDREKLERTVSAQLMPQLNAHYSTYDS